MFTSTDSIAHRKRETTINRAPVICGICGLEIPGTDAEIKRIALMRHTRTVHQIRPCEPEFTDWAAAI